MNFKIIIFFLLVTKVVCGQNSVINLVNCSSNFSNYIEYNTGEIFVKYDFNSNVVTSKEIGLEEFKDNVDNKVLQIKLYPNPVINLLYYNIPEEIVFECIEIYDQYQKFICSSFEKTEQVSLEGLPSGIYYVRFNKKNEYNFKVIKQ